MSATKKNGNLYEVPLSIVLFLLIIYFFSGNTLFIKIAFGLGIAMLLSKTLAKYITLIWGKFMALLGFVNSHVLLSLIFFLILAPISFFYRLTKKDSLNLGAGKDTYYTHRDHTFTKKDLQNPW